MKTLAHLSLLIVLLALGLLISGCPKKPSAPVIVPPKLIDGIGFEDVTLSAGLDYTWPKQPRPLRNLEAFGTGCAFIDYDDDGWQDILLVAAPYPRLYHNQKKGTFIETTKALGLDKLSGDWKGVAVGDFNDDGTLDLVLTGYRCLALLKNDGGKAFTDVTEASGFRRDNRGHWGASAGFMDLVGNGRLDLVLLNYVVFGPSEPQFCDDNPMSIKSGCPPSAYKPEFPELWENRGDGKFTERRLPKTSGKALVVAFTDANGDGRQDLYIGNDGMAAELLINQGGMRFTNEGMLSGVAYGMQGHTMAAMGADWADYDRDGLLDLAVTGFSGESYMLYRALGKGAYEQASDAVGLALPTYKPLGFGAKWLDFDNDGFPDLVFANGHVYDNTHEIDSSTSFLQPLMLFQNQQGKRFRDLVPLLGGALARPILGRGLATGDFDNDGRMDFLAVDYEGRPLLAHNLSETKNHYLTLDLRRAEGRGNRFAYGATITASVGKEQWVGQVSPASAYLSSSDPRIHLGLGRHTSLDSLTIRWPDGKKETRTHVAADQILSGF
ncbi:CRTAC1 family protein [Armatimonas sp.]|uniref:CRTAC1 family protein n=1 Tax=Armatimonas sp. TaxID=1872638 RepID=UPI00286D08FE|nr:CRTAC1 family protein [Armatimonas sp.]